MSHLKSSTGIAELQSDTAHEEPLHSRQPNGQLLPALLILKKNVRLLAAVTVAAGILATLVLIFVPNYYAANSTIVIPSKSRSLANSLVGQLGPLAALTGDFGVKDSSDRYLSLLKSNSIADILIQQFNLQSVYKKNKIQRLRDKLADHTRFQVLKGGLITISVTDKDPKRAADLANAYVEQLYKLNSRLAVDEAARRREFYQKQVDSAKQQLTSDEQQLKNAQETTGLIQPDAQAKGVIEAIVQLRTLIAAKQTELRIMETFGTNSNPDIIRRRTEVEGLRAELKKLENSNSESGIVGPRNLPSAGLEYARRLRDVKTDEAIMTALIKEFEEARVDEARRAPLVQMVDRAQVPDEKAGPERIVIIIASMLR